MPVGDRTTYVIDREDRLTSVNSGWSAFAEANGAEDLDRAHVVGDSIWRHIRGTGARRFFQAVFDKARRSEDGLEFPFRCDSPDTRRQMQMRIRPSEDGSLHMETFIREEAPRRVPGLYEPPDDRLPTEGGHVVCTVCKAVRDPGGTWYELDDALEQLELFIGPQSPTPAYDVCPTCEQEIFDEREAAALAASGLDAQPV